MFKFYFVSAVILIILVIFFYFVYLWIDAANENEKHERLLFVIYIFSVFLFVVGYSNHNNQYYVAIDPIYDGCYTPFGGKHFLTLAVLVILFWISMLLVWIKEKSLPPLTLVLSYTLIIIGIVINIIIALQVSYHNTEGIKKVNDGTFFLISTPILGIILAKLLLFKTLNQNFVDLNRKQFNNRFLDKLNSFLYRSSILPIWTFVFTFPVLIIIIMILVLFGQDADSLINVFTDTATWRFSQQMHPPILIHNGHYLCTVAAKGNPEVVKPLHIGIRRGRPLIVNRQLKVANAFEEMIEKFTPKFHRIIRGFYDKYGYNLSTKINNERMSNLTYWLMKPLEYIFIISLYLFWNEPEKLISKQYRKK